MIERGQSKLDGTGIVKAGVSLEVHMKALGEWFETMTNIPAKPAMRPCGPE